MVVEDEVVPAVPGQGSDGEQVHERDWAMMMTQLPDAVELQERLDKALREYDVPGAVLGVLSGDDVVVSAAGIARLPDGPPVRSDTLFLIASITKVWTATMVLQLVDEGAVDLDAPVNRYLEPPLRLPDQTVADTVTVRHMLCHTGGFYGDKDEPEDRSDDAVRTAVESFATLPQLHRPGTLFSYSNAGFDVLGRIVECLDHKTWDQALKDRLLEPLGLAHTFTLPEEAAVHPLAVGHEPKGPDTLDLEPVKTWLSARGSGPCGGTLATTASDLLEFTRMHMRDGVASDGRRVLSERSARLMRESQIDVPDPSDSPAWGLGWALVRQADPLVIEHGGNTHGQLGQLVAIPEHDLAICVLTNGDTQGLLRKHLVGGLVRELLGVELPRTPSPGTDEDEPDLELVTGRYRRSEEIELEVRRAGDGLTLSVDTSGEVAERVKSFTQPLVHAQGWTYLVTLPQMTEPLTVTFVREAEDDPRATHLSFGLRLSPCIS